MLTFRDNVLSHKEGGKEAHWIENPEHHPYFEEIAYFIDWCLRTAAPTLCLPTESAQAVELSLQLKASRDAGGKDKAHGDWPSFSQSAIQIYCEMCIWTGQPLTQPSVTLAR